MSLRTAVRRLLRGREEQRAITSLPWDAGGVLGGAGVSPAAALSLVPVFASVRLLASQIASLPLQSYRHTGGTRTQIRVPSLFDQPSAHGTLYDWLHRCVTSLALRGNAYGLITARDGLGYPTMIEWLHPDHVTVMDRALYGPGSYMQPIWYWNGRLLPTEDLVHIAWFTVPYRVLGLSPIEACAATISTGVNAQSYTSDWFTNGAVPPGTMRNTQQEVSQTEADEIKGRLVTAIRSRKPLVFGHDWEYAPIAVAANEAKFVETLRLNATQVAAIFGVPPEMVGGEAGGSLTYNTVEQNGINFVKMTLRPWLELLEEAFSALRPTPQYVKFNLDALLRGDLTTRLGAYQVGRTIGLYNLDECRANEDLGPLPNGEGQDYTPLATAAMHAATGDQEELMAAQGRSGVDLDTIDVEIDSDAFAPLSGPVALALMEGRRYDPADDRALGHDTTPGHDELHHYWTVGVGRHEWVDSPEPWTTLVALLTPHVGLEKAKIYASRWFFEVKGYYAGSDKNRVAHGHPPRGKKVGPG